MKQLYLTVKPLSLVFLILLSTCTPKILDEPVRVIFEISMTNTGGTIQHLSFTQMIVSINSISFLGIRQVGDDVYFHTRPGHELGTHALTSINNKSHVTYFDIQQGNYQNMRWDIKTKQIGAQFYDQNIFFDDDETEDYTPPGLLLIGNYTWLAGGTSRIYISISPEQLLRAEILSANGVNPFPIIPDNIYNVTFDINPYAAFSGISRQMIEEADTETNDDDETEYIIISPDENVELYTFIMFRLAQNITATIR